MHIHKYVASILAQEGFEVNAILGDFDGGLFSPDESEHVVITATRKL